MDHKRLTKVSKITEAQYYRIALFEVKPKWNMGQQLGFGVRNPNAS